MEDIRTVFRAQRMEREEGANLFLHQPFVLQVGKILTFHLQHLLKGEGVWANANECGRQWNLLVD